MIFARRLEARWKLSKSNRYFIFRSHPPSSSKTVDAPGSNSGRKKNLTVKACQIDTEWKKNTSFVLMGPLSPVKEPPKIFFLKCLNYPLVLKALKFLCRAPIMKNAAMIALYFLLLLRSICPSKRSAVTIFGWLVSGKNQNEIKYLFFVS